MAFLLYSESTQFMLALVAYSFGLARYKGPEAGMTYLQGAALVTCGLGPPG